MCGRHCGWPPCLLCTRDYGFSAILAEALKVTEHPRWVSEAGCLSPRLYRYLFKALFFPANNRLLIKARSTKLCYVIANRTEGTNRRSGAATIELLSAIADILPLVLQPTPVVPYLEPKSVEPVRPVHPKFTVPARVRAARHSRDGEN